MSAVARQQAFAAALVDPATPVPVGVVAPGGRVDAARFAVYRNNVFVGLVAALAKSFPVTRKLVGDEFFAGMARAYAGVYRAASPLLFRYGAGLPDFIATFPPAASVPYLADVARLETAWLRAYHAADLDPLSIGMLMEMGGGQLDAMRLFPHPAAALVRSQFPVGSIWAAHQSETVGRLDAWRQESVLIARPEGDVTVTVLPDADAGFAQALLAGAMLGDAAKDALAADPHFDFGKALVGLVALGAFAAGPIP